LTELRVGLGCMRLPVEDEQRALDTIAAAAETGMTVFDTAHSYGPEDVPGHNERLLARGLRRAGAEKTARIVTKGGMTRAGGRWIPDGRARTIRADCEASLEALDGLAIDVFLVHTPDPARSWKTSARALAKLVEEGLVRRVGVANVNRAQLDGALELAPVTAVQVALSPFDDRALRGGIVERCADRGLTLIAHSPLGGPKRAARLTQTEAERAIAWVLALGENVIAIPGARRPETARSAAHAASLRLTRAERDRIARVPGRPSRTKRRGDVVLVMGIPGAGKSVVAEGFVSRGYQRLNRDERGGSLRDLASALNEQLAAGARQVVLDNTYLTRASRSHVLDAVAAHGLPVRCIWLDPPLAQAQVNIVERLLDRFGTLPTPDELKAHAREPGVHAPTSQMRAFRELEPPSLDEGFAEVEAVPFARAPSNGAAGVFVAGSAADRYQPEDAGAPHLIFDWSPEGEGRVEIPPSIKGATEVAVCVHGGGPPVCWCRPPLPGLLLAFARRRGIAPARSLLVGTSAAHKTLATTLGARYVSI
jgi:aryl-alcohol dehydrogenase-like predicted oxidoreductase